MAFKRIGTPVEIELIRPSAVDAVICRKCGRVMMRAVGTMKVGPGGDVVVMCGRCGEESSGL